MSGKRAISHRICDSTGSLQELKSILVYGIADLSLTHHSLFLYVMSFRKPAPA